MSIRRCMALVFVAVTASGCLPFLHPGAIERDLEGTYDQVFQATLETLEARGFPLGRVDRDEGVIETGKRPTSGAALHRPVETVRAEIEREGRGEASVQLLMTFFEPAPSSPRDDRDRGASRTTGQIVDRSTIYDDYLDAIGDRVHDLRGTDTS